jgi:hypothetical protein
MILLGVMSRAGEAGDLRAYPHAEALAEFVGDNYIYRVAEFNPSGELSSCTEVTTGETT